jgi:act minimal PKS chain-length factor (CLF/KS beta)
MRPRAVVTGLSVVAPNGLGVQDYWAATLACRSGIRRLTRFDPSPYPARLAGEVPGFVAEDHVPSRLLPQTDHMTRLFLAAVDWALKDSGVRLAEVPEFERGVVTASTAGGYQFGQPELQKLWSLGASHVSAYMSFAWFYAVNAGQTGIRHGLRGPCAVVVSENAGGLDAVGQARRNLRKGASLMVTGAVDSALAPWAWVAYLTEGGLSREDGASQGYLPFDAATSGFVPGEGGAILILEDEEHARGRGAERIYGEVAGYASCFEDDCGTGSGLRRAAELALADAELTAADISAVIADGAGVPELDQAEARAISAIFGPRGVPVTVPKSLTGRLGAGGSSLDLAAGFLAIRHQVLPPTLQATRLADGIDLDVVVGAPRRCSLETLLVLARGRGGFNAAMVIRGRSAASRPRAVMGGTHNSKEEADHGDAEQ